MGALCSVKPKNWSKKYSNVPFFWDIEVRFALSKELLKINGRVWCDFLVYACFSWIFHALLIYKLSMNESLWISLMRYMNHQYAWRQEFSDKFLQYISEILRSLHILSFHLWFQCILFFCEPELVQTLGVMTFDCISKPWCTHLWTKRRTKAILEQISLEQKYVIFLEEEEPAIFEQIHK